MSCPHGGWRGCWFFAELVGVGLGPVLIKLSILQSRQMLKRIWWEGRRTSPKESSGLLRLKNLLCLEKSHQSSVMNSKYWNALLQRLPSKIWATFKRKSKHETMAQVLPLLSHSGSSLCHSCQGRRCYLRHGTSALQERDAEVPLTNHKIRIFWVGRDPQGSYWVQLLSEWPHRGQTQNLEQRNCLAWLPGCREHYPSSQVLATKDCWI